MKIVAIAIGGVIMAAIVKSFKPELSIYVVLATVIIIFLMALDKLTAVFQFLSTVYGEMTYGKNFFPIIIKVLVVAYLADFTAQLCKDAGEGAIAGKVELAGKIVIFYLSMPILLAILELINSVL
ncbi:stage III sporulation protein AD [Anaerovorax odorimutans]|uniref:Stage III sporulation protein AD n=1 Tax=Anaerovorax odorimutans TaxID=109327 RepID=A0ABT1RLS6_9FIRM|nr:SpoIIIAC/SpoIIIAD family protein [Anaerovorax odorimutans]MCQ4635891.1 stage III sporulation protein AD [Anaerovorax odorimutans]